MKTFKLQARFLAAILFVVVGTSLLTGCSLFSVTEADEIKANKIKNKGRTGDGGGGGGGS